MECKSFVETEKKLKKTFEIVRNMPSSLRRPRSIGTEFRIVGKRIGAGNFGEVYLGENVTTGQKVAVKVERDSQPKGVWKV